MTAVANGKHHLGSLANVTTTTKRLPSRVGLHALQKWGKTSFAAQAPDPIFLCSRGEDGLMTLIDSGQLPPTPHFPVMETWVDVKLSLNELIIHEHPYRTLIVDTLNGLERLRDEHVIRTKFDNDPVAFDAWGRGPKIAIAEFIELTTLLDRLREKGMSIIILMHSMVKTFKNPSGQDYDRWEPTLGKETWAHIDRWLDMILFGTFETLSATKVKDPAAKIKAKGGQQRLIMTQRHASYDAGNRHGLPEEIDCGQSPQDAWRAFIGAMKKPTPPQPAS